MNKAKLKTYAPQARKDFIAAVTARAHRLGLSEQGGQLNIAPAEKAGDLVIIAGQSWPAKISRQRDNLIGLMQKHGFAQTLENVAYTWFNRFAALRYMEIHDYLNHGYRVLSSREGGLPEILGHAPELAQSGDLPGLNPQRAIELKLAGDQDGELYRWTLIAQCNALSKAMPFLFERIDDETELLLPDNLLLTDSVIAKLVEAIPEEDWSQVEIIGWLYQFYISDRKDQVIGKVVKSEDIPAATQLFTPNWIVQYLVQNSVGRLWLMANPASTLKNDWPYYIEPAEQTPEVQAQLDALIQTRMAEDGGSLNPETLTVLDPACGSGHILVEAYEVLKSIYLERGYQPRSIPRLILEKNLYGLDIDDRAAQLAGFALLMKARADDRRLLDNPPKLNVLALQDSKGLDPDELTIHLAGFVGSVGWVSPQQSGGRNPTMGADSASKSDMLGYAALTQPTLNSLLEIFTHAKTFGSLIQIPAELNAQLPALEDALQQAIQSGDLFTHAAAFDLLPLVRQAQIIGMEFDAVVANPPYMGGKGMNVSLKDYAKRQFPDSKSDLFAMFIERGFDWCKPSGFNSMVTMQSWMFLSCFESFREKLINSKTILNLVQIGYNSFPEMNSKIAQACSFSILNSSLMRHGGIYVNLNNTGQSSDKRETFLSNKKYYAVEQCDFSSIEGAPIAYWINDKTRNLFRLKENISRLANPKQGSTIGDNEKFLRLWFEISSCANSNWKKCLKGGAYRRWYGNREYLINWGADGKEIVNNGKATIRNKDFLFKPGIEWGRITSSLNSFRVFEENFFCESASGALYPSTKSVLNTLGFLNSRVANYLLGIINPTLTAQSGDVGRLPYIDVACEHLVSNMVKIAKADWDQSELSWDFLTLSWLAGNLKSNTLELSWERHKISNYSDIKYLQQMEEQNNRLFIEAYGLQDELSPEVPEEQISLARADREKDCQRLISYAIGCMMGRYSLDEPGLIYAHAGNVGFDPDRYNTFPADADGIVPITDELWFEDDAANRIREFLLAVWGAETLEENLAWLAESLGQKANETPEETIRRYLAGSFFKDHLQTYKKRPIYWLFSSGKQGAFQALVYLHRYHEGTLARMRAEYVVPLTGKIQSRIEMLEKDAIAASSNAARNKLNKDIEKLKKKHVELLAYDEKLRHYADRRIQLDLDDGVKVNYGKFGDLLAEVKAVTGGASDD
ncbi:BREX-1 system adenine-specific DNA-methyltransferase PglX [Methylomonas rapida]|uniref:site-specific DNA-methyltransferase (adenine-specific) n=1 Tax=Methylomonas rapida TaxID=2963939 RepID=A0ABY7GK18_9GAMM|nr:BREX-1 system adenine-specific DNA-methyltransferase PglX [Methylomonas rapida]WAR43348.1 BREX-1 system adenine-specific DNA-methyltransferase PglX [Methylomonas rapida]